MASFLLFLISFVLLRCIEKMLLLIQLLTNCNFLLTKAVSLKAKHSLDLADVERDTTYLSTQIESKIVKNNYYPKQLGGSLKPSKSIFLILKSQRFKRKHWSFQMNE